MTLIRTVPPAALPVSLAEFKAQARVDLSDEDAIAMAYLRAATDQCEHYTNMGFLTQTWKQSTSAFPASNQPPIKLYLRPVQQILSIEYLDESAATQTLSTSVYRMSGIGWDIVASSVGLAMSQSWPTTYSAPDAVRITYKVGFGDNHNAVPEDIRLAILIAANTLFGYREDVVMGSTVSELPTTSKTLLRRWRPLAVA